MYLDKLHKESERENSLNKLLGVLDESVNGNYNYLARKPVDSIGLVKVIYHGWI